MPLQPSKITKLSSEPVDCTLIDLAEAINVSHFAHTQASLGRVFSCGIFCSLSLQKAATSQAYGGRRAVV